MEPLNHFLGNVKIMSSFYEWPKTRSETNIFYREVFKLHDFWPELLKKYAYSYQFIYLYRTMYGVVTAMGDTAPKLAAW
jgi:hypothetical protein